MRSSSHASIRDQRGFVLISVLILAILYLALMELMLRESSEALRAATRFRARVIAQSLAEDGVELAAQDMVSRASATIDKEDAQGKVHAEFRRTGEAEFRIASEAKAAGPQSAGASVVVTGRIFGSSIAVDRTIHSQ